MEFRAAQSPKASLSRMSRMLLVYRSRRKTPRLYDHCIQRIGNWHSFVHHGIYSSAAQKDSCQIVRPH